MATSTNVTVTFSAGQFVSNESVDISNATYLFLVIPPDWDAANITFLFSIDGTTFFDLLAVDNSEPTIGVTPGSVVPLNVNVIPKSGHLKLRSGSRLYPVAQSAARTLVMQVVI